MSNYGLVSTTYTERPALAEVARWNDNIRRHTLYTVCDSMQDIWGLYKGVRPIVQGSTPVKLGQTVPFDAAVGAQASAQLFNWVPISYPASYVGLTEQITDTWNPKTISLNEMVTWGFMELKSRIESTTGTFALVGYGMGASVCSKLLQEMQSQTSTIKSRYGDCIGAVMFSNPCRQEGVTYPGGTDPGGAGIMPQSYRNTTTPSWWWEMAIPDDPVTTCPIDVSGQAVTVVAEALFDVKGARDFMGQLGKIPSTLKKSGIWPTVAGRLTNKAAVASALAWSQRVLALNPSPHNLYSYTLVSPTATYLDTAIAHINLRGTTISPR